MRTQGEYARYKQRADRGGMIGVGALTVPLFNFPKKEAIF
jgi:hypothetical protein